MTLPIDIPECPVATPPLFGLARPWLAPLAGYSDLPFRLLCRERGADVCETEMISAKGLFHQTKRTLELLRTTPDDGPLVVQLFGGDPGSVEAAARALRRARYFYLDFNVGCSVRKVMRQGAGAALLGDRAKLIEIAKRLAKIAATDDGAPKGMLGFKLRLGLDKKRKVLPDLGLALEDAGADWLTLHPRYASDGFSGEAHWEEIAKLVDRVSIPVIVSGDLFTAEDGLRSAKISGASGVMYARGALYNPDIFDEHKLALSGEDVTPPDKLRLAKLIKRHIALGRLYGPEKRALVKTRSLIPRYVRNFPGVAKLRGKLCEVSDWSELDHVLAEFFSNDWPR